MKQILHLEVRKEKCNAQALGAYNASLGDSHIGYVNIKGAEVDNDTKSFIARQMKSLNINEKIDIVFKDAKGFGGYVILNENGKVSSLVISSNLSNNNIKNLIAHELTHVSQINSGRMKSINGDVFWKGEKFMTGKERLVLFFCVHCHR